MKKRCFVLASIIMQQPCQLFRQKQASIHIPFCVEMEKWAIFAHTTALIDHLTWNPYL